jgi:hypothetical protein
MSLPSPTRRVRIAFLRAGVWASVIAFLAVEGYVLHDQWEIGHASHLFMLGTALFVAGICIGLFALIAAMGLIISMLFGDERLPPRARRVSVGGGPTDPGSAPRPASGVKPNPGKAATPPLKTQQTLS